MKRLFLFLLISSCYLSYSQTIDILLYNYGSTPVVSQPLIIQAYESAGFNDVNLDYTNIDTSLNVNNYDVLIVHEGNVYDYNLNQWVPDPLNETKRVLIENFVINGGHVVWVSESNQSVFPNKSNITINNIYGTNLQNGPFYALIYGPSGMNKIHPSNGPGGLSSQDTIFASGSYSTILNVPNCNKLYSVSNNQDEWGNSFDECTHTTFALFPSKPKPDEGSIIVSTEVGAPFAVVPTENWDLYNTQLELDIASMHYHLLVDEDLSFNEWTDDENNLNPFCPPINTHFGYSDTVACLGDSITITTETDTAYFNPTSAGTYNLTVNFGDGICVDDTLIIINIIDFYAQVPNDTVICSGNSITLNALNQNYDSANWNNGVINNQAFIPNQDLYYTLTLDNQGCIGRDSVYISVEDTPDLYSSINADSICFGEEVILNASSSTPLANVQWQNGIVNNQAFRPDSSTIYIATATLSICSEIDSIRLFVGQYPDINTIQDFSVCDESIIFLSAEASQGANLIWENGVENGLPFLINESNVYYVSAELFNCISQDSVIVQVLPKTNADFEYTIEPYSGDEFKGIFENNSSKGDSIEYFWTFVNNSNTSADFETNYIFNDNREYVDVSLLVSNQFGCNDSITKSIRLNPDLLNVFHIPNTFTPNNDQINDTFKPIFNIAPLDYKFTIYNRWGEEIFVTKDYKDGWNGLYQNNLAPKGVYVLKLLINRKVYTQSFTVMSNN
ncbi:MAG: gliding motility-associated C-terminal domain-containing protein [Flavobacteriales bacterium]